MSKQSLKRIFMHLARTKEHPNGSLQHGYELIAPLDATDHIDADAWHQVREKCTVRRYWAGEEDETGHLKRRPGGSWVFHYDINGEDDDEAGYRFGAHPFREGEYISIKDEDGDMQTFIISKIDEA